MTAEIATECATGNGFLMAKAAFERQRFQNAIIASTMHDQLMTLPPAALSAFKKLSWAEFEQLLLLHEGKTWDGHLIGPRPMKRGPEQFVFRESPKVSRRPLGREVDKWQNSGGKKGSTLSPDGNFRCRYGTVTSISGSGVEESRKYVEVSFVEGTQLFLPESTRNRVVFQVLPQRRDSGHCLLASAQHAVLGRSTEECLEMQRRSAAITQKIAWSNVTGATSQTSVRSFTSSSISALAAKVGAPMNSGKAAPTPKSGSKSMVSSPTSPADDANVLLEWPLVLEAQVNIREGASLFAGPENPTLRKLPKRPLRIECRSTTVERLYFGKFNIAGCGRGAKRMRRGQKDQWRNNGGKRAVLAWPIQSTASQGPSAVGTPENISNASDSTVKKQGGGGSSSSKPTSNRSGKGSGRATAPVRSRSFQRAMEQTQPAHTDCLMLVRRTGKVVQANFIEGDDDHVNGTTVKGEELPTVKYHEYLVMNRGRQISWSLYHVNPHLPLVTVKPGMPMLGTAISLQHEEYGEMAEKLKLESNVAAFLASGIPKTLTVKQNVDSANTYSSRPVATLRNDLPMSLLRKHASGGVKKANGITPDNSYLLSARLTRLPHVGDTVTVPLPSSCGISNGSGLLTKVLSTTSPLSLVRSSSKRKGNWLETVLASDSPARKRSAVTASTSSVGGSTPSAEIGLPCPAPTLMYTTGVQRQRTVFKEPEVKPAPAMRPQKAFGQQSIPRLLMGQAFPDEIRDPAVVTPPPLRFSDRGPIPTCKEPIATGVATCLIKPEVSTQPVAQDDEADAMMALASLLG